MNDELKGFSRPGCEQIQMKCPDFTYVEKKLLYVAMMDEHGDEWIDNDYILDKMSVKEIHALMNKQLKHEEEIGKNKEKNNPKLKER